METLLVFTNMPDRDSAAQLANKLVAARLAACVNALAPCISTYHWQGKLETTQEIPVLIKTRAAIYPEVERAIREAHPYELPEIIAVPIVSGLPAYLNWIASETSKQGMQA